MSQRRRAFRLSDGTIIYDVLGADSEDENEDEDEDEDEDLDEDEDEDDVDDESASKKRKTRAELEAELAEERSKAERADRRMRRADRAKSKTVNELNALKAGGQKELADAQARIAELEAEVAAKSGTDTTSIIREEFRDSDKYDWQNRKVAFGLLDLSEVDVDEDGNVDEDSLNDAIEKLAKEHPYLIKVAASEDADDDDEDDAAEKSARKSGAPVNKRRQSTQQKSQAQLKEKFPILGGRF